MPDDGSGIAMLSILLFFTFMCIAIFVIKIVQYIVHRIEFRKNNYTRWNEQLLRLLNDKLKGRQ